MNDYTGGIKVNLTEEDIKEAIEWGKENKNSSIIERTHTFGDHLYMEWEDGGRLLTKYLALALLSADLAKQGKSPSKTQIEEIANSDTFIVEFTIRLRVPIIFEDSTVLLKQGRKTIHPVKTEVLKEAKAVPDMAMFGEQEKMTIYDGCIAAYFPYSEIDPKAITRVAFTMKGGWVSLFKVDFSTYK